LIFVRETSDPLTGLVKKIDQRLQAAVGKTPRAMGVYVIFVQSAPGLDQKLRDMVEKEALKRVNLCIGAPPAAYAVAQDADVTVVIYNPGWRPEQHVTANFALRKGELDESRTNSIVNALSAMLPK
jgi:hypothetical protein